MPTVTDPITEMELAHIPWGRGLKRRNFNLFDWFYETQPELKKLKKQYSFAVFCSFFKIVQVWLNISESIV